MAPTAADVASFLGQGDDQAVVSLAEAHLPIVTAFVHAYTRGRGFDGGYPDSPADDIRAVIIAATARMVTNPEQARSVQVGDAQVRPAVLDGFTLPELAVLHLHRKRTA